MSSRQMRRKRGVEEEVVAAIESSEEEETFVAPSRPFNPFDMLEDGDEDDEVAEVEVREEPVEAEKKQVEPKSKGKSANTPAKGLKASKKKQGKKKAKNEAEVAKEEDDLDAILASVPVKVEVETKTEEEKREKVLKEILKVEANNLDPSKEMARLFGAGVVGNNNGGGGGREDDGLDARMARRFGNQQQQQQHQRGAMAAKLLNKKRNKGLLVKAKASWAPVGPSGSDGLEMVLVETKKGIKYFKFDWSKDYRSAQRRFHEAVETGDPNALAALLRRFPYHIDTLLQLHDAFQMTEEKDAALDLLERIMFRFEASWLPSFDIVSSSSTSSSRLPYEYPENRSFHLAILAYLQEVGKKGCSATALEFSKLLLSFDLSDPLGVLFLIDHFALRRREHLWLLRFYHSPLFEEHDLSILPNFVYSIALSAFYYQKSLSESSSQDSETTATTLTPVEFGDLSPELLLHTAFEMHPSLFVNLAQRLATGLIRAKDGKNVLTDLPHFSTATASTPPMVNILHHLYIERNHALWKDPACITWLKQCASSFYEKVKVSSLPDSLALDPASDMASRIASYQTLIASLTVENPKRFHRHIMLSDINAIIRMLPSDVLREGFHIYEVGELGAPSAPDAPSQRDGSVAAASNLTRLLDYLVPFQADPQQLQNILNLIGYRVGGDDDPEDQDNDDEEE